MQQDNKPENLTIMPAIFGCAGFSLSEEEKAFFEQANPAGFILFSRNIDTPEQVKALTAEMRGCSGIDPMILIDQEGGRVQRLTTPHWRKYPAMSVFGDLALKNSQIAARALRLNCRMIATDLRALGINVDCLPVLDVPVDKADPIIGDRALSLDANLISALGRIVVDSVQEAGVLPVLKHLPGHGRANVDSHLELPVVDTSLNELRNSDLIPFIALNDAPLGMTAHITYSDIDPDNCATLSSVVIGRVIRMVIGFKGLLMSDDLSMQALSGTMIERAEGGLKAGCDLLLHCNGNMEEMIDVAAVAEKYNSKKLGQKVKSLIQPLSDVPTMDKDKLSVEYDELMERLTAIINDEDNGDNE